MTSMRELIGTLPGQLRWAADLEPPSPPPAAEALVAGMGGSGIAGSIASVVAACAGRRVAVHRSYGLPGWAGTARPLAVIVSHSGDTEEALSSALRRIAPVMRTLTISPISAGSSISTSPSISGASRYERPMEIPLSRPSTKTSSVLPTYD